MLSTYAFYKIYLATKLHLTTENYDVLKYTNRGGFDSIETFDNRSDLLLFSSFANKIESTVEALKFCTFNFLQDNFWLYSPVDQAKDKYLSKKKFYSNFTYNISKDHGYINQLRISKNLSFKDISLPTKTGRSPPLLQLLLQDRISIEFICYINSVHNFIPEWKSADPVVNEYVLKIEKYQPLMFKFK